MRNVFQNTHWPTHLSGASMRAWRALGARLARVCRAPGAHLACACCASWECLLSLSSPTCVKFFNLLKNLMIIPASLALACAGLSTASNPVLEPKEFSGNKICVYTGLRYRGNNPHLLQRNNLSQKNTRFAQFRV